MSKLFVIGAGPGATGQLTFDAAARLREVSCIVVAPRHCHILKDLNLDLAGKKIITLDKFDAAFERLTHETGDAAVIVSGDPGIYSLLPLLKKKFSGACEIKVLPGLSALQCICAEVGETWADAIILSGHGRELPVSRMLNAIERNRLTIIFCDKTHSPDWVCKSLVDATGGLGDRVEVVVGERLSAPDQRVTRGRPGTLIERASSAHAEFKKFDAMSIVLVMNEEPWSISNQISRLRDEDFVRVSHDRERDRDRNAARVPMTRFEVRGAALDHLELTPDAVMWDIGAGTGSVSIAAALAVSASTNFSGEVHAVEFVPEALELLKRNREKFRVHNMMIHEGRALDLMLAKKLPRPTHVFIGGSGGELEKILAHVASLARGGREGATRKIRVVVSAVTLDTLSAAVRILSGDDWCELEAVQIAVSKSRTIGTGRSLLMAAQNSVTLLCANASYI